VPLQQAPLTLSPLLAPDDQKMPSDMILALQ
jgi:hypothetical protein